MYNEKEYKKWSETDISEKVKLSLSVILIFSSIIIGFISFFLLKSIPESVLGLNGIWISSALGLLGLSSYVTTSVTKMKTEFNRKIYELDETEKEYKLKNNIE